MYLWIKALSTLSEKDGRKVFYFTTFWSFESKDLASLIRFYSPGMKLLTVSTILAHHGLPRRREASDTWWHGSHEGHQLASTQRPTVGHPVSSGHDVCAGKTVDKAQSCFPSRVSFKGNMVYQPGPEHTAPEGELKNRVGSRIENTIWSEHLILR